MDDVADLLRPSLTEADDATGFRAPWDPDWLCWLVLLVGPFGAGGLMWLNQRRLGLRGGVGAFAAMAAIGVGTIAAGMLLLPALGVVRDPDNSRLVRYLGNLLALPLAFWLLRGQRRRFHIAEMVDVAAGRLLGPGIIAWFANLGVVLAVVAAVMALRGAGRPQ